MVNYVRHFRAIQYKMEADSRVTIYHLGLYWALFQTWNEHSFQTPIHVYRDEIMARAKIRTRNTYAKCMRELSEWNYISYDPAAHCFGPWLVAMRRLDGLKNVRERPAGDPPEASVSGTVARTSEGHVSETTGETACASTSESTGRTPTINYINNTNIQNNLNDNEQANSISNFGNDFTHPVQTPGAEEKSDTRGAGPGAGDPPAGDGTEAIPASLDEVYPFFASLYSTRVEAEKFYHYFNAKGWRIGEKSPMHNWRSAARHWILNAVRFNPHNGPTPGSLASPGPQNYAEPL
jgi:hypothetical protein